VIAAGGGGTLRAVVEGVLGQSPHARIAGLRLGSGNVIPRRYGVPRDPIAAARTLIAKIEAHSTRPCAVIRCEFGGEDAPRHGITMCGLGHFGRTSGDLVRLHARAGELRRAAARLIPLERLNDAEYVSSFLARMAVAALVPSSCELVTCRGRRFRLLAGVVLTAAGRSELPYYLVPRYGRPLTGRLQPGEQLSLQLADRRQTEFFLDEDPELATGAITITAAGTLDFVA
jgi:diacylglycerol kinase-like protein